MLFDGQMHSAEAKQPPQNHHLFDLYRPAFSHPLGNLQASLLLLSEKTYNSPKTVVKIHENGSLIQLQASMKIYEGNYLSCASI